MGLQIKSGSIIDLNNFKNSSKINLKLDKDMKNQSQKPLHHLNKKI